MLRVLPMCLLYAFSTCAIAAAPIECVDKINPELVKLLESKFPDFHIPHLSGLDHQSIGYDLSNGGDGCYAVAKGDFDGDKKEDVVVLLTSNKKEPQLIAALQRGDKWSIYQLPIFCETIQFCYVAPKKAGTYLRTLAAEDPITRKNERSKLTSNHMSVISGTLESTGIVYVYSNGHWNYVWVSD